MDRTRAPPRSSRSSGRRDFGRLNSYGPTIVRFLSMVELGGGGPGRRGRRPPFRDVKKVVERVLDDEIGALFDDFDEQPFAVSSLGQVYRARTSDGEDVAVKVQHPGLAKAVEGDLRNLGVVGPLLGRIAPGLDAGAVLAEIRERISDQLDGEVEAQNQRRHERLFRVTRTCACHACTRSSPRARARDRVGGRPARRRDRGLGDADRDRVGEIAFRFFFGLVRRDGAVVGDPAPENSSCPGRTARRRRLRPAGDLDTAYLKGERDVCERSPAETRRASMTVCRAWATCRARRSGPPVRAPRDRGRMDARPGFPLGGRRVRRPDPGARLSAALTLLRADAPAEHAAADAAAPPHGGGLLELLGALNAGADWGTISAKYHSGEPPSTPVGREDRAFFDRRARR